MAYGFGPMQLGMAAGNPQHAALQQAQLQQSAAQQQQLQQAMQQRAAAQAQAQQTQSAMQGAHLRATQPVRDNPAMQQMVDVARQQDQQAQARQLAQQQADQQQQVLDAAGRGPGIPPPQDAPPGFMQQSFAERMKNPYIQALLMGGLGMAEAGSRGEGPMQAFMRGGMPRGVAALQGAQGANEEEAQALRDQQRDDQMYELQRRALEQRIALGMPAEERRGGRMSRGVQGYV